MRMLQQMSGMTCIKGSLSKILLEFPTHQIHLHFIQRQWICKSILQQTQKFLGWTWNLQTHASMHLWLDQNVDGLHTSQQGYAVPNRAQWFLWLCSCTNFTLWPTSYFKSSLVPSSTRREAQATSFCTCLSCNGHMRTRNAQPTIFLQGLIVLFPLQHLKSLFGALFHGQPSSSCMILLPYTRPYQRKVLQTQWLSLGTQEQPQV